MTRDEIVAAAREWIGTPYKHQYSVKHLGTDCLGLVRGVYRDICGPEPELPPPYTPFWGERTKKELLLEAARKYLIERPASMRLPGVVVMFRWRDTLPCKHCGILTGPNRIIHAYDQQQNTQEVDIPDAWVSLIKYVFDFPGVGD